MASVTGLTIDDFEKLPDALALNHELVDGELVEVSGNTLIHNRLRHQLVALLSALVGQGKLGEIISEQEFAFQGNAHAPDVCFVSAAKLSLLKPKLRVQRCVPDLAIEIVSENDKFEALMKKAVRYRRSGTQEVWVFSIENRVAFLLNENQRVILDENQQFRSDLIPGFSIRIGDLLDRL
jgi:Uma2 family endonuclease